MSRHGPQPLTPADREDLAALNERLLKSRPLLAAAANLCWVLEKDDPVAFEAIRAEHRQPNGLLRWEPANAPALAVRSGRNSPERRTIPWQTPET